MWCKEGRGERLPIIDAYLGAGGISKLTTRAGAGEDQSGYVNEKVNVSGTYSDPDGDALWHFSGRLNRHLQVAQLH